MIVVFHSKRKSKIYLIKQLYGARLVYQHLTVPMNMDVLGGDANGNIVLYLSYGRYKKLYLRAMQGIVKVFELPVELVDVDRVVANAKRHMTFSQKILFSCFPRYASKLLSVKKVLLRHLNIQLGDIR